MSSPDSRPSLPHAALEELRAVVGGEHVLTSPADLERYSRCTIPWQRQCGAVVFPDNAEEVAGIVRIAGRYGIPLWPFSTGVNQGYGATLATADGALVMLLTRMNRILEVNDKLAYAVIEPGVTYRQLNAYLKEHGHRLWLDCTDGPPQGSVLGNALDRGIGETPYGDHFGNLCGLEVVLPTGERIHTGGQLSGLKTWHMHKWGVGPYLEGLFTQSNLGIVTQAGIWLMPQPEAYNSFVYEVHDERHVPRVFDAFLELALHGVVNAKMHMINDFVSITLLTQRGKEQVAQKGPLTEADLAHLRRKFRIAEWSCAGGLYGTRAQVRLQRTLLRKALGKYGKLTFIDDTRIRLLRLLLEVTARVPLVRPVAEAALGTTVHVMEAAPHVHGILQGIPSDHFIKHAYYRYRGLRPEQNADPARDHVGLVWFAPILPFTKEDVLPFLSACRRRFAARGFDFWVAQLLMNPRSVICLMSILYDREDAGEVERARRLYDELIDEMQAHGYQQYRCGLGGWPRLFEQAPEMRALNDRLKSALDPANTLAPGRYGMGAGLSVPMGE